MNKTVVFICITAIVVSIVGVMGWIIVSGSDAERIMGWAGTTIGPLIAALATYLRVARVSDNVEQMSENVDVVKRRTNGTLDLVFNRLRALEQARAPGTYDQRQEPAPNVAEDPETGRPPVTGPG